MQPPMQPNPYAAPAAEPIPTFTPIGAGDLTLEAVLKEAWRLTKGFKLVAWAALVIVGVLTGLAQMALGAVTVSPDTYAEQGDFVMQIVTSLWQSLAVLPLSAPLYAGIAMLALRQARGEVANLGSIFDYFGKMIPLVVVSALTTVLIYVGFALLILPGIYLSVALMFSSLLVADRDLGPIEALKTSLATVHRRWFHVFGVLLVTGLLVGLSALALGIGLIWTLPWFLLVTAVLYRSLFEAAPATEPTASPQTV